MDIVLELTDTFIADYVYAYFTPARPVPYDFPFPRNPAVNASTQAFSAWTYKPATKFIQIQPSQAAYMASMTRDDPRRQALTLFFITWYVPCCL